MEVTNNLLHEYPSYCKALLEKRFAGYAAVTIEKEFTDGQSGTFVFLVRARRQSGEEELPVVVKIGPSHLLEQEQRAAEEIADRLPGFVPISGQIVSLPDPADNAASYSAARYPLVGDDLFDIQSLREYSKTAPTDSLWTVLETRLFKQLAKIWNTRQPPVRRRVGATYDRVLPVNLLLEAAPIDPATAHVLDATRDPATYPACAPGDAVVLRHFVITEIDLASRTLTLDLPLVEELRLSAYRLRLSNVANPHQYRLHETVSQLAGRVLKTRQLLLQAALHKVLPSTLDLTQPFLPLPGTNERLPNPLLHWPPLLQEALSMRLGTVHGDFNTGNVLIDVAAKTVFLIDGVHVHLDHALYDLARLESEVLLHMGAHYFYESGLPPTKLYDLYGWLDYVTRRDPAQPGRFAVPQPLRQTAPALQPLFIVLTTIRNAARPYLATPNQWREYYNAVALTLLGSVKFASLDRMQAGTEPKALAFWGAATLLKFVAQPADWMHIGWQLVTVHDNQAVTAPPPLQPAIPAPVTPAEQQPFKILILTANPLDTVRMRTDEEARAIDQVLRQTDYRIFKLAVHQAVRIDDLQALLLRHQPDILHFSGHGTANNELLLQDANGNATPVNAMALRDLFAQLRGKLRCVVFNTCYSADQAMRIAEVVDCVVGSSQDLSDEAAIHFATAFYRALSYGHSVQTAFDMGQVQLKLIGLGDELLHLHGAAAQTRFKTQLGAYRPHDSAATPYYENRRLDAAMPARATFNQRTEVRALLALPDSDGLSKLLPDYTKEGHLINKEDMVTSPSSIRFTVDPVTGQLQHATLRLQLVAPDFKIDQNTVSIEVVPGQESGMVTFHLTPTGKPGLARVLVELYNEDGLLVTTVSLSTEVVVAPIALLTQVLWQRFYAIIGGTEQETSELSAKSVQPIDIEDDEPTTEDETIAEPPGPQSVFIDRTDQSHSILFEGNESVIIQGNVIAGETVHQTNFYGPIEATVYTGNAPPIHLETFLLPFKGVKAWASDFLRIDAADEHARSSWAGMTLYLLGSLLRRISSENLLTIGVAALTAALAIWLMTPLLSWPQATPQERLAAVMRFGCAWLLLPLLIAFLTKPEGLEQFTGATNAENQRANPTVSRRILLLQLTGAWISFGAIAGMAFFLVVVWYHLFAGSLPIPGRWLLALLPPFFAYVSARRTPLDRHKQFDGEIRPDPTDRLFLLFSVLLGPLFCAVIYWGHWFLINPAAMLSLLLGLIGLTVWAIHRQNKKRFSDVVVIAILGLVLPLGFFCLFFFGMQTVAPLTFALEQVTLFVVLSLYFLSITLLLATVLVRQPTVLTIPGVLGLALLFSLMVGLLGVNRWLGAAIDLGLLMLWYGWGRARVKPWHQVHASVDLLALAILGATIVGIYTPLPLLANATLFALVSLALALWAYQQDETPTTDVSSQNGE